MKGVTRKGGIKECIYKYDLNNRLDIVEREKMGGVKTGLKGKYPNTN